MMGAKGRVNTNERRRHRDKHVPQVPSTPSRNLYPVMIQLGRRVGKE